MLILKFAMRLLHDGHDDGDNHDGVHDSGSENDESDSIDISGASLGFRSCKTIVLEQDAADCVECDKRQHKRPRRVSLLPLEKYLASLLDYQKSTEGKFCGMCAECESSETESENARLCDTCINES
jgi:hypothetical protein